MKQGQRYGQLLIELYTGWRSSLSATYKAYNNYDERMRSKPEDLDIVEWHYLVK